MDRIHAEGGREEVRPPFPFALLAWLYLIVLWLTWSPTGGAPSRILLLPPTPGWNVVVGNLALFAPMAVVLVVALRGFPRGSWVNAIPRKIGVVATVAGVVALLSLLVEVGQLRVPGRTTSPYDVAMNSAGAAGAAWLALLILRRGIPGSWLTRGAAGAVLAGVLLFLTSTAFAADRLLQLHQWSPEYEIVVGEEVGGPRSFVGTIGDPRICAGSGSDEVCVEPIRVESRWEGIPAGTRKQLQEAASSSQAISLSATIRSEGPQIGPARIITFSRGTSYRNATLGQEGADLILRLRTPLSGPNATEAEFHFPEAVEEGVVTRVRASYQPGRAGIAVEVGEGMSRLTEIRWGLLSSWTLLVGPRENKIESRILFWAALVGAAGFSLPLGMAASGLGVFGMGFSLPLRLRLAAGAPPALLLQLSSVFGIPLHLRELLLAVLFGLLGAVAHHAGSLVPALSAGSRMPAKP